MKVSVIAYGTRGDVQPLLTLAWELKNRGHDIRLLAPRNMAGWAERARLPFVPLPLDVQALFAQDEAQRMLAKGDIASFFKWLAGIEKDFAGEMRDVLLDATSDADALVCHALMEDRAAAIAAARNIPMVPIYLFPLPPSSTFPSPFITTRNLGPFNRLTHKLLLDMLWKASRDDVAILRDRLKLPPAQMSFTRQVQRAGGLCLLAYSSAIFPTPRDYGGNNVVTGGFTMPPQLRALLGEADLPGDLLSWIAQDKPPVFLGFGSMPVLDTVAMTSMLRAALSEAGVRGVLGAGWSNLPPGGDALFYTVGSVDHDALFRRCAAAVHHGGSSTTYASLRAGLPTLICSVFADQPFWGARIAQLGVGATMPFAKISAKRLQAGLDTIQQPQRIASARNLASRMASEDGVGLAARVLEERLPRMPPPS